MFRIATVAARTASRSLGLINKQSYRAFASVGDKLPSVNLHSGFPPEEVNLVDYTNGKNILVVGLPGAFTPT